MSINLQALKASIKETKNIEKEHIMYVIDAIREYETNGVDMTVVNNITKNTNIYCMYQVSQSGTDFPVVSTFIEGNTSGALTLNRDDVGTYSHFFDFSDGILIDKYLISINYFTPWTDMILTQYSLELTFIPSISGVQYSVISMPSTLQDGIYNFIPAIIETRDSNNILSDDLLNGYLLFRFYL